ncbi:hypothetical protein ENBRE01_2378, partial [Enteropsectra breve]
MNPATKELFSKSSMALLYGLTSIGPLVYLLFPSLAGSLGTHKACPITLLAIALTSFQLYLRTVYISLENKLNLRSNNDDNSSKGLLVIQTLKSALNIFNSLALPLFFCYVAFLFFQHSLAISLLPSAGIKFALIALCCGFVALLLANYRFLKIRPLYYIFSLFSMLLAFICGVVSLILSSGNKNIVLKDTLNIIPPFNILGCLFMVAAVKVPRAFLNTASCRWDILKKNNMFLGVFAGFFYGYVLMVCNSKAVEQIFTTAKNILFSADYKSKFMPASFAVALALGFISLCPVVLMFNEHLKKMNIFRKVNLDESIAMEENRDLQGDSTSEASSNGNKRTLRYFSSFYMCYLLACIFICPVLLYYDTFRNV